MIFIFALFYVLLTAAFLYFSVRHYCSCRDREWIKWCKDNNFHSDKWPEYGYRDD